MGGSEVVRRQPVLAGQGVDVRRERVADDRGVAGVLHHDLDDVLVVRNAVVVLDFGRTDAWCDHPGQPTERHRRHRDQLQPHERHSPSSVFCRLSSHRDPLPRRKRTLDSRATSTAAAPPSGTVAVRDCRGVPGKPGLAQSEVAGWQTSVFPVSIDVPFRWDCRADMVLT